MTVQHDVRPVTVPRQGGPVEPPLAAVAQAAAPGRAPRRPLDRDERQFVFGLAAVFALADTIIVTGSLLSVHVWS